MNGRVVACQPLLRRAGLQVDRGCTSEVPLELPGNGQAGVVVTLILFYVQRQE